ncbi:hypothetical protein CR513_32616, partial [Mucuna pruriens]
MVIVGYLIHHLSIDFMFVNIVTKKPLAHHMKQTSILDFDLLLDSSASHHVTHDLANLRISWELLIFDQLFVANGKVLSIKVIGFTILNTPHKQLHLDNSNLSYLWHHHLGHLDSRILHHALNNNNIHFVSSNRKCPSCLANKSHKLSLYKFSLSIENNVKIKIHQTSSFPPTTWYFTPHNTYVYTNTQWNFIKKNVDTLLKLLDVFLIMPSFLPKSNVIHFILQYT